MEKVEAATAALEALEVPELPEYEDESVVTEGRGVGSSYPLLLAYDRLLEGLDRIRHYHFELLNLGYGAYLAFYELCRQLFPDIADQTIAKSSPGSTCWSPPDDELKRLAQRAVELASASPYGPPPERRSSKPPSRAARPESAGWPTTRRPRTPGSASPTGSASLPPSPLVDRRPDAPDRDDRLLHERLEAGEDIARPQDAILPSANASPPSTAT